MTMPRNEKTIYVYADWMPEGPVLMGSLYASANRGKETFSFSYSRDWLEHSGPNDMFDPDLFLYAGRQYSPPDKPLFGLFADSCPDRWGRLLMRRREAINARHEERKPRTLLESDYLLGVYDETRMGALRFSLEENGPFLSSDKSLAAPPWTMLRTLETASIAFENEDNPDEEKWLRQLLAPGSSLGGARPKASVTAPDGSLWIAKFPSKHDEWNTGAWEITTHDLAQRCGLDVPEARLKSFTKQGSTFLIKRFDRDGAKRLHFASAMTLLGRTDGADDASYLDLASFIRSYSSQPKRDLRELWSRIVFNVCVSNTDDHLRNHGFLLTSSGWRLSPVYDVNPTIYGDTLSLGITREDSTLDLGLVLETAELYGLGKSEAMDIAVNIQKTVRQNWQDVAASYGLGREAMKRMAPAFEMAYKSMGYDEPAPTLSLDEEAQDALGAKEELSARNDCSPKKGRNDR